MAAMRASEAGDVAAAGESAGGAGVATEAGRVATGLTYGLLAYGWWGFLMPLYLRWLGAVEPLEQLACRVVFAVPVMLAVLWMGRRFGALVGALRDGRTRMWLLVTSGLITVNWLAFVLAVSEGRLKEASLGYYINPLLNVALGRMFLGERLRRVQWLSVGIAACAVGYLMFDQARAAVVGGGGQVPWITVTVALTFGTYGLIRKRVKADAAVGLSAETLILLVPMLGVLGWVAWRGESAMLGWLVPGAGAELGERADPAAGTWLGAVPMAARLTLAGAITALPLLWFVEAARRLTLATVGVLQYIAPTGQFVVAVWLGREAFTPPWQVAFGLIWVALVLFTVDAVRVARRRRRDEREAAGLAME